MFWSAHLGRLEAREAWRSVVRAHAAQLGLGVCESEIAVDRDLGLTLASLAPPSASWTWTLARRNEGHCLVPAPATELRGDGVAEPSRVGMHPDSTHTARLTIDSAGGVSIEMPIATPEQCFHAPHADGHIISNDLRLMVRCTPGPLDPRGVYALFQYGAVPAPICIVSGVRRVPCGHAVVLRAGDPAGAPTPTFERPAVDDMCPTELAESRVMEAVDTSLAHCGREPLLFFSGGIDSTFLAWRMKCIGRGDVRLVNYGFGPDDPDALASRRVAASLGLPLDRIDHDDDRIADVLGRIGEDYTVPFGDYSSIPTNLLVHEAIDRLGVRTIIDGTGADGLFGIATSLPRWRRIARIPRLVRLILASTYGPLGMWKRPSDRSRIESLLRVARRTSQMSLPLAIVSQNPLDGIAYRMPPAVRAEIDDAIHRHILSLAGDAGEADRLCMLDIVHVCAGQFAAKSHDPIAHRGAVPRFPFLDPDVVSLACGLPWSLKCRDGVAKALLIDPLGRVVPAEVLDRPKTGFTPPLAKMLTGQKVQERIRALVLTDRNPFLEFLHPRRIEQMLDHAARTGHLSVGALNLIWSLTFASAWWQQIRVGSVGEGP